MTNFKVILTATISIFFFLNSSYAQLQLGSTYEFGNKYPSLNVMIQAGSYNFGIYGLSEFEFGENNIELGGGLKAGNIAIGCCTDIYGAFFLEALCNINSIFGKEVSLLQARGGFQFEWDSVKLRANVGVGSDTDEIDNLQVTYGASLFFTIR